MKGERKRIQEVRGEYIGVKFRRKNEKIKK